MNKYDDSIICIDFKVLMKKIIMKWRRVLICMLLFILLGGAYGYFTSSSNIYVDNGKVVASSNEELKSLGNNLSDREIMEAEEAADVYMRYYGLLKDADEYLSQSIRMSLNNQAVPTLTSTYYIDNKFEVVYPTIEKTNNIHDIIKIYSKYLDEYAVTSAINDELGWDIDDEYYRELYLIAEEGTNLMSISVIAPTREDCYSIMSVLENAVYDCYDNISKTFGDFDIHKQTSIYQECYSSNLLSEQLNQNTNRNNIKASLLTVNNYLSADQKNYFSKVVELRMNEERATDTIYSLSKKYILLGAFLGLLLACFIEVSCYIFSNVINSKKELKSDFGLTQIGEVYKGNNYKGIDRILFSVLSTNSRIKFEDSLSAICSSINLVKDKNNYSNIGLINIGASQIAKDISDLVKNQCEVQLANMDSGIMDSKLMNDLSKMERVIIITEIGTTKKEDVNSFLEVCDNAKMQVLGTIIIL